MNWKRVISGVLSALPVQLLVSAVGYGDWLYVGTCYAAIGNTLSLMKALQSMDPDGNGNPDTLAQTIKFSCKFVFENITISNIASAIRLLNYMRKAKQGFDLYVSEDGVNFQTITVDGFGDPYNHGLRVFATTDQGLCLGTANPFYGTQVWIKRKDS